MLLDDRAQLSFGFQTKVIIPRPRPVITIRPSFPNLTTRSGGSGERVE
jgi:hypothetical protein